MITGLTLRALIYFVVVEPEVPLSYSETGNTAPDAVAIADGDDKGRGTGVFLDVYNESAGTNEDLVERKNEIKINKFNSSRPYPNFNLG